MNSEQYDVLLTHPIVQNTTNDDDNKDENEINDNYKIVKEIVKYEKDEIGNQQKIIIRYIEKNNRYIENLKKAQEKYRENNKEKINKLSNEIMKNKYQNDPEYREQVKQKRREYYLKNKK